MSAPASRARCAGRQPISRCCRSISCSPPRMSYGRCGIPTRMSCTCSSVRRAGTVAPPAGRPPGTAARDVKLHGVRNRARSRFAAADIALAGAIAVVVLVLGLLSSGSGRSTGAGSDAIGVTVLEPQRAIPDRFLGLSLEYRAVEAYAGADPKAIDPVFEQLVRNLSPGQRPWLRIGGDSADWTWWPLADMSRPPGVTFSIDRSWIEVARALAQALDARML